MKHGSFAPLPRFLRTLAIIASVAAALFLLWPRANSQNNDSSIVIDREVLVPGLRGKPNAMARLNNGRFVIVGAFGTAWAVGTDANGKLLWKYEEARDPQVRLPDQSEFHGVVALANGGALLCGETSNKDHQAGIGLIVIMSADGQVVERRNVFPNDDQITPASAFRACFPWGTGFALTGGGYDGKKGFVWLMQVDKNGARLFENTTSDLPGISGESTPTSDLVLMGSPTGLEGVTVVRLNQQGTIVARRKTNFLDARPIRSVDISSEIKLIAGDNTKNNVLLTLNDQLQDKVSSKRVTPINIGNGCAYALTDGSIVLFGNVVGQAYRSAIAWVNRPWKLDAVRAMSVPIPQYSSFSVRDAVPLSANQFVAMRDQVTSSLETSGVVLSWVTLK
jgi:hypothetical protein